MLGILVQLIISWLIIWLFEKGNLKVLGFYPTKKRLIGFACFLYGYRHLLLFRFFYADAFCRTALGVKPKAHCQPYFNRIWWNLKSVLFEELIFRGVLFYILIKKLGHTKAIIISAIAFGVYHWFSHETIGKPVQMLITFLTTGTMGLVYAYAYSKTFSLYYPIAIHLGWNLTSSVIFSPNSILGDQLFTQVQPVPEVTISYFTYYCIVFTSVDQCNVDKLYHAETDAPATYSPSTISP